MGSMREQGHAEYLDTARETCKEKIPGPLKIGIPEILEVTGPGQRYLDRTIRVAHLYSTLETTAISLMARPLCSFRMRHHS